MNPPQDMEPLHSAGDFYAILIIKSALLSNIQVFYKYLFILVKKV